MSTNTVSIDQLKSIVRRLHSTGQLSRLSLYVSGPPGIGKTAAFQQLAQELNADHRIYLACTFDPTDVSGVPFPQEGMTRFLPPERLLSLTTRYSTDRLTLAVFDDLPACHEQVFAALFRFFYERYVGDQPLRDNVLLCATGNRVGDMAGARELPTALANRFIHYELKVDVDQWVIWAIHHGIDPMIIAFVRTSGVRMLHDFDPSRGAVCFPTPRSVANASMLYQALEHEPGLLLSSLAGACGEGWAHAFWTFASMKEKLVPIDVIIADPMNAPIPQEIDVLYAVTTNLTCAIARDTSAKNMDAALRYAERIPLKDMAARTSSDIARMAINRPDLYKACEAALISANRKFGTLISIK